VLPSLHHLKHVATADDSTSISLPLVYKMSPSWVDALIYYALLFVVVYLSWCNFAIDPTQERH
jgi:hypothetical protein